MLTYQYGFKNNYSFIMFLIATKILLLCKADRVAVYEINTDHFIEIPRCNQVKYMGMAHVLDFFLAYVMIINF